MRFNFNHGQSRVQHTAGGMPIKFHWRSMTPKKILMFALMDENSTKVRINVDDQGYADVIDPLAIQHIATLGYPVAPAEIEACAALPAVFPGEDDQPDVLDWSRSLCATGFAHKALTWRGYGPNDPYAAALPDGAVHLEPWRHVPHWIQNPAGEGLVCWCKGGSNG